MNMDDGDVILNDDLDLLDQVADDDEDHLLLCSDHNMS